jgi:GntR family transcriptional regulator
MPTPAEAADLNISPGDPLYRIERIRLLDGQAVINERILLACARFPGIETIGAASLPNTLYDFYQTRYGISVAKAVERIKAVAADATDAKRLGVHVGYPLLAIHRVAVDLNDNPVEIRLSHCLTERYHYLSELL